MTSISNGADVVVGPSLFQTKSLSSESPWMLAAAAISWGFVIGKPKVKGQIAAPTSLVGHNVAFRKEVCCEHPYATEVKRSFVSSLLFKKLVESGVKIVLHPDQRVAHTYSFRWWLLKRHWRYGWEIYDHRRLDKTYPYNKLVAKLKFLAPLLSKMWHVLFLGRSFIVCGIVYALTNRWQVITLILPLKLLALFLLIPLFFLFLGEFSSEEISRVYGWIRWRLKSHNK